jgi:hypothetical protein
MFAHRGAWRCVAHDLHPRLLRSRPRPAYLLRAHAIGKVPAADNAGAYRVCEVVSNFLYRIGIEVFDVLGKIQ